MAVQTSLFNVNIDNVFNQFVCVGPDRRNQTSQDGETWTARTWTTGVNYQSMAFGKNVLVIVASTANTANRIYTNIDGYTAPTARTHAALGSNVGWQNVAFGNDTWVAVAGGAATQYTGTSTDSATWTLNSTALTSADYRCVEFAESKFVTCAYNDSGQNCSDYARYSSDGVTWSNGSGLPKGKWTYIAYDATLSRFVAVSQMPVKVNVANSSTGLQFTTGTNTITRTGNFTTDTYFVGCKIVISGTASNDGTYTVATVGTTTLTVNEALSNEAANTSAVMTPIEGSAYSDDGITWTVGSPTTPIIPLNWKSIASSGLGRFVAIANTANNDSAAYSTDGINWTTTTLPIKTTWLCCGYGNGRFVALAASYLAYSDDNGATWKLGPTVGAYNWAEVKWIPIPLHTNDTLTIDRGSTVTVNTDQHAALSGITITNGKLRIENSSTSNAIRFITARTSGILVQAITPSNGLGTIEIAGNWIQIGTGDNSSNQTMTVPYTDYVPCLWVETGVGTNEYEIWLNVSGAYGGSIKHYQDGLLDVSTGQRGKFFIQTPNATQDKYLTATVTTSLGLPIITMSDTTGIYQGASITGMGIPASTVIEEIVDGTTAKINQAVTITVTAQPMKVINPYASQFTNQVVFGDGVNGNKLTNGVKVRIPNIMLTSDTPANLHTSSYQLGMSFVMTSGGNLSMDTCLFDEAFHNLNQTQSLTINDVGWHLRPIGGAGTGITEVYDLNIDGLGCGMPAVRRFNNANVWQYRDTRDTLSNSLLMNFISNAVINNLVMVVQSPNAVTAGGISAPIGMLNLANSDNLTVSNCRFYSLNTIRAYHHGLCLTAPITNSTFTDIEYYGGPMLSAQLSSGNTFTNLTNSETMFSHSHFYSAGMRVTFDPNTDADMVSGTKYYFKSRTFYTSDRTQYTESRTYSATPFKGSTYYPDYITAYLNAPQSVTFGWTHRTPMYTAETSPLANANAHNFLEIYRHTSSPVTKDLAHKVAGFNVTPSISIPTVITWATDLRTLTLTGISVSASGGRTMTFDDTTKTITASSGDFAADGFVIGDKVAITGTSDNNFTYTITNVATTVLTISETPVDEAASSTAVLVTNKITASSGSFITDGYAIGDKLRIRGSLSSSNNATFTISNVTATVINVTETIVTQSVYVGDLSIIAKYEPTPKIFFTAGTGSRNLTFTGISVTSSDARTFTFGGTVALPAKAVTMSASSGRTLTFTRSTSTIAASSGDFRSTTGDGFVAGDKIYISDTTYNNTMPGNYYTVATVNALSMVLTPASDLLTDEGLVTPIEVGTIYAIRSTITCSSGDFRITTGDGFIVGDKLYVSGSSLNDTTRNNYLTITAVAATMITCSGDFVHPEGPLGTASPVTLSTNRLAISSGSFVTDGFAPGDIVEVSGSANANNNRTFTVIAVAAAALNFIEATTTQAVESSGATLTVKTLPFPKVVYHNAAPNREVSFQKSVAQAATTTRIMTFNGTAKTITSSGTAPGNFITEGFVIGDKVVVTNTTYNNKFTLTLTAVTATVLTATAVLERQYDEVSTTATLTANRIKVSNGTTLGPLVADAWAIGDTVTVTGTSSNNGTYTVNNVATLAAGGSILAIAGTLTNETASYKTGCVLTATKVLARQKVYANATRTFATGAGTRTITLVNPSGLTLLQDGYIVGDRILVNGMCTVAGTTADGNNVYQISALSATVITFLDPPTPTAFTSIGPPVTWVHAGQRPAFTTTAATMNLSWSKEAKTLSLLSSTPATISWDYPSAAYNFKSNDRIFITGQKYNNGVFTINRIFTKTITASASRTLQWTAATKLITQAGAGVVNFDTEGYLVGDKIIVAGTTNNNGIFTIAAVGTTTMTVLETLVNEGPLNVTANMSGSCITVDEPVIPDTTIYNATAGTTSTVYGYHNPQKITVTAAAGRTLTFNSVGKSITASTGSFILDGYVMGDCIQIANTTSGLNDGYFTIAAVSALVIYVNEQLYSSTTAGVGSIVYSADVTISAPDIAENTDYYYAVRKYDDTGVYNDSEDIYVKSTPQEIQHNLALQGTAFTNAKVATLNSSAARTLQFYSASKTIVASSGSFITDTHVIGDRIYVSGTTNNNGWYQITGLTATIMTVAQSLTDEGPLSSLASISNIYWQNLKRPILTASTIRTLQWVGGATKTITLAGTTPGSWITDGYAAGDRLVVAGTTSNNGTVTIKSVDSATQITVYEAVTNEGPLNATATITNTLMTIGVASRVSPFVSYGAAQTAEALLLTSLVDNATITQAIPMAIDNAYTFSVWVCVQPTILKLATLTASAVRTLTFNSAKTITVAGTSPGSFVYDSYQIGDTILVAGTASNNGWFTIANVTDTVITVNETMVTEGTFSATATITNYFTDTLSIDGEIRLGTTTQAFTATAQWQKVTATFTATANLHLAVIQIDTQKRGLCVIGAMVNVGSSAMPYIASTTAPTFNNNKVRDINLVRTWCRGYGEAESHSGIELQLAAANTGELFTEVFCGTTSNFTPTFKNKVFDTWKAAEYTLVFNQASQNNVVDNYDQVGIAAPTAGGLAYFAAASSNNKIKNLTFNIGGTLLTSLISLNTQSNDISLYNWNIENWRNYATTVGNVMIFPTTNATSGLVVENLIFNNSDFPIQNACLNAIVKGMNGGNVKPLNSALFDSMPLVHEYVLGGGAVNYDSLATSTPTVYTTVYDTIFNELYFTTTTGALSIVFNASAKDTKPYTLSGDATFSNNGRLYFRSPEDSVEYTWPHTIIGTSGFRNLPLLLNGVDLGNTPSLLEGLLVQYKIDTGSGYPVGWTDATPANLAAETVSSTTGFNLKIKITAKLGMKYSTNVKNFVVGETIKGTSSLATAVVDADFDLGTYGTLWLSSVTGTFAPGEIIVKDSNGEMRATNVATNTVFATFPSFTSYIDGLQIYTNVDQGDLYPPDRTTLSLTGIKENSEIRIYSAGTTTELSGIESSATTFDYEYVYAAGTYIDIVILHLDWNYYKISNYLLSSSDATLPIAQITDRVYSNV